MKLDIKMLVIIGLALTLIGFIMFSGKGGVDSKYYEKERAMLQKRIDSLETEKSNVDIKIGSLENNYVNMVKEYDKLKIKNDSLDNEVGKMTIEIENRKNDYYKAQKEIKELNDRLVKMKNNPPNREGDNLIENLRNKFN